LVLLKESLRIISKKKFKIVNIDSTVILEEPKIGKYRKKMNKNITKALKIAKGQLSIKATTSEGLGSIGMKKGCCAYTICSLK